MNQVYKTGIRDVDGDAAREFILEHAKIFGNKTITVVLEAQPSDQDANIPFVVLSQFDENGVDLTIPVNGIDVSPFIYDNITNLLSPRIDINNVKSLEFHHLITYTGSNQSGGNNDANDVLEVIQRIVNSDGGTEIREEIDKISSAVDLPSGETIQVRKVTTPEPQANPIQKWGINSLIGLGWSLKEFNNSVITCSNIRITIGINYYDATAKGGTDNG